MTALAYFLFLRGYIDQSPRADSLASRKFMMRCFLFFSLFLSWCLPCYPLTASRLKGSKMLRGESRCSSVVVNQIKRSPNSAPGARIIKKGERKNREKRHVQRRKEGWHSRKHTYARTHTHTQTTWGLTWKRSSYSNYGDVCDGNEQGKLKGSIHERRCSRPDLTKEVKRNQELW